VSEFLSRMGGAALNDLKGTPLDKILNHLMGGQQGASGLEALVEKLRSGGLGDRVDSWISTGTNRPVAPQELEQALSPGETDRLASDAGMERPGLLALLSQMLPRLIDGLTPQGRMPTQGEVPQGGLGGMLRDILGHLGGERGADDGPRPFGESPPQGAPATESPARPQGTGPVRNT
jgi:uncharacterized protein YidB (DUF937 family)